MVYQLFLPDTFAVLQDLYGRAAQTDFALLSAFIVVVIDPFVQIDLQLLDGLMDILAEGNPLGQCLIKILQDGFVGAFTDAIGLG